MLVGVAVRPVGRLSSVAAKDILATVVIENDGTSVLEVLEATTSANEMRDDSDGKTITTDDAS
jgi:hypothetical protein